jgi:ribonuclease Z
MMKMDPPVIYLPEHAVEVVENLLRIVGRLDRSRMPCQLLPVKAGDEIEISREHVVTAVATRHTIPSLGFIVWQRRRKLKPEYADLAGEQIRDLRLSGVEISREIRSPLVAYLGDSAPEGLDDSPDMYQAQILIAEMTFVAPNHRKDLIHKNGHMHLDDFVARRERFQNEKIVAAHFSTRYNSRQIRQWVEKSLPDMLGGRLHLWL